MVSPMYRRPGLVLAASVLVVLVFLTALTVHLAGGRGDGAAPPLAGQVSAATATSSSSPASPSAGEPTDQAFWNGLPLSLQRCPPITHRSRPRH